MAAVASAFAGRASCPPTANLVDTSPFTLQASFSPAAGGASPPFLQHVVCNSTASRLCVSSSSKSVLFFDSFTFQQTLQLPQAHAAQITNLSFFSASPDLLASSSQDGTVRLWDCRVASTAPSAGSASAACVRTIRLAPAGSTDAEVWTVSLNSADRLLATNLKQAFFLFDLRATGPAEATDTAPVVAAPSPAGGSKKKRGKGRQEANVQHALARVEAHSDTITSLIFHPTIDHLLFSGGEDQLVCVYDLRRGSWHSATAGASPPAPRRATGHGPDEPNEPDEPDEEEDRLMVSCFSHERPVKKVSVLGPEDDCLCVTSPMEDIALWQLRGLSAQFAAGARGGAGDMEVDEEYAQRWEIAKKADWTQLRNHPSLVVEESSGGCIVESFYEQASGRLFLLAGSVRGDLLLFHANLDELLPAAQFVVPQGHAGHNGLVRDATTIPSCSFPSPLASPSPSSSCLLVTCGEDGRLCAWKQEPASGNSPFACVRQKQLNIRNHRWPQGDRCGEKQKLAQGRCAPY
ncbi:WD domain, G-beta repeat-containing protein [Besnoitia besnoiti]|uniref:WD domain, G-beta repeat-containing protein n=1 Tax=Besnoitia besnoiti TaxID=94643 RepID=A0A2A9M5H6_BESBE|nr:WD domain, G-beta repeat-containing protein [Besnoitia besnoiti]PFH31551.1 WD domain, G-beta repeat-containing protein [Besnoitia besnoiti]